MRYYTLKEKIKMIKDMKVDIDKVPTKHKEEMLGFNDAIWKVGMILNINNPISTKIKKEIREWNKETDIKKKHLYGIKSYNEKGEAIIS